ncbi:Glucose/arabinose dehydrogenase, beta-propeller fold [Parapedobacter luteus]|uniref:Glucose/arabinose dehydrogenase, beta-propeller fold n=1 Tax=Parapedobacter luteus TaxID=623280 RepID=A0A1T5CD93_9SPHI|nr:sorbosone dehydrogenase family protein [Parapedobacter luteus]SKB57311.1 Glucose/arabinose dehydrogenase, beta-propeller fold [Parapedobacter luteus]
MKKSPKLLSGTFFRFFVCCMAVSAYPISSAFTQEVVEYGTDVTLPQPMATPSATKLSKVVGWPEGQKPTAPEGYRVVKFADKLNSPRWIYQAPNGDIFVSEARTVKRGAERIKDLVSGKAKSRNENLAVSSHQIILLRDTDGDAKPDLQRVYLDGLNQPFGMLVLGDYFYVANTDGLWRFPYDPEASSIVAEGEKLLALPAGGYNNHWTRNIVANADGSKIYISVGSGSNVGENGMEHEVRRANIIEVAPDGTGERIFASGLRNPVGMDWEPQSGVLWTAVNERDELGDALVPDYITAVQEGGFYGWPYAYWGKHPDPNWKGQHEDLVAKSIVPDYALGSHTASLGLAFSKHEGFRSGAYIGQHGSWNRSELVGYKVVYVPFDNGKPTGMPEDFLSGFIADAEKGEVYGRPVGVTFAQQGYLLVTDDAANTIWAVVPE